MGPFTALLIGMFVWPVQIMWRLFKLMIPIAIVALAVTWRLGVWTVRTTGEGISWAWKWRQRLGAPE
jgi:hypothetical protein